MAVIIESSLWEPSPFVFIFIFFSCFFSLFLYPYFSKNSSTITPTVFDHGSSSSFLRFQRNFLLLYSIASAMEGLWSVFGEFAFTKYGASKEQMLYYLCFAYAAALLLGFLFGVLSDLIGHKKVCLVFFILHLFVGIWKRIAPGPSILIASTSLSLASSIFSFSFETWMVVEHEKQGHRQYSLSDTFWLMTFFEAGSLIGSQVLVNWLVDGDLEKTVTSPSTAAIFLALTGIICITRGWKETPNAVVFKDYRIAFSAYIFGDKRIWLLAWAQACHQFSIAVFWIIWAPTLVADGREIQLGLIYPCLLGARMLGSTIFPWLSSGSSSIRTEDFLIYAYTILGFVFSIVAYDYQEIGVLVTLFCVFHVSVGLVLPSLARLRTMIVPKELRGGMISLSLAPANAAVLILLMLRGYYGSIGNAEMFALAAMGLFIAAGCMYILKRWGKQPYQNWHKL